MKRNDFYLLLILVFYIPIILSAQNSDEYFVKLIDSETSESVSFATIRFKGTSKGIIADYNGEFRLPVSFKTSNNELVITSIGYRAKELLLSDLSLDQINIIQLIPQIEALDTVVINSKEERGLKRNAVEALVAQHRGLTSEEIVNRAIRNIPKNLSAQPHSYVGYYRDYQIVEDKFHNLNEGIFEVFDNGVGTNFLAENQGKTAVYSYAQNTEFIQDAVLQGEYNGITKYITGADIRSRGGNEFTILNTHNPIRSYNVNTFSYVYTLKKDFVINHSFRREGIQYLNNEPLAVIKFKKHIKYDRGVYGLKEPGNNPIEGSILISLKDYSIHRFNYTGYGGSRSILFNVSIEYARQYGKMFLNYISFNNAFVIRDEFEFREQKVIYDQGDKAFHVIFNNTVDPLSIDPRDFSFKLKGKRLRSLKTEMIKGSELGVRVEVENWDKTDLIINDKNLEKLTYKIRNVFDITGREIYDENKIDVDQFREFFVQEVKPDQALIEGLRIMPKNRPVIGAPLNTGIYADEFLINSPLMNKKYRDEDE